MKSHKPSKTVNKTAVIIASMVAFVIMTFAIVGALVYINQQNIAADEREMEKQLQVESEKESKQNEIDAAKLKQDELDSCLSNIDRSQHSSLQSLARSSCYYSFNNS